MVNNRNAFEEVILPHLDAAYNLARWLTRNADDAGDVVQESLMRAYKYFSGYRGGQSKAWFLTIVRNTSTTWLQRHRTPENSFSEFDDVEDGSHEASNPETEQMHLAQRARIHAAVQNLPLEFREVLVLRELEGLSYKEIAKITGRPAGTVMSRLNRAREKLKRMTGESPTSLKVVK